MSTSSVTLRHRRAESHQCAVKESWQSPVENARRFSFILSMTLISNVHSLTKRNFQSIMSVHNEVKRHVFSKYWFVIHPYSKLRLYWDSIMAFTFYYQFLNIPFAYAFNRDLQGTANWFIVISMILDILCLIDVFLNFYTGFRSKHKNQIVLDHGLIIRNYLSGSFASDILSSLPFNEIYRFYSKSDDGNVTQIVAFHFAFLMRFLRFASMNRMIRNMKILTEHIQLSYVKSALFFLCLETIFTVQFGVCLYKAVASSIFYYLHEEGERSPGLNALFDPTISYWIKYYEVLDVVIWALFDTSFNKDIEFYIPGKIITSVFMLIGVSFNIYLLIRVLNIMNITHAPKTKFYEIMNQLDAFMQKKQIPIPLQNRLKFFYKKKFKRIFYREGEIFEILSEPLQREILINTGQLFVERVLLFKDVSKSIVSKIASSCRLEQFLPNDLIIKAGSMGDCIFFIASGTVAFTTTNGMELFHLEDGDHFGEIALILKNNKRIVTATAIEFCEIYILDFVTFKKYVNDNEPIMKALTETANARMKLTLKVEEEHKKEVNEKIARESFIVTDKP